jgi:glycosyltransferase involved in cell wall biosynthesis
VKILLVGNYERDGQKSMLRFCSMLESQLRAAGHNVTVIRPTSRVGLFGNAHRGSAKWLGYADKFLLFRTRLKAAAAAADVVHVCDHSNSLYIRHLENIPHVVTCHDLIAIRRARGEFTGMHTRWTGRRHQEMVIDGLRRARHIVCVSESTRADLLRIARVPLGKTSVVHSGLNYPYVPLTDIERNSRLRKLGIGSGQRYLLHVGSGSWYKNQSGVIRIFNRLTETLQGSELSLVIVCNELNLILRKMMDDYRLSDRVRVLFNVEAEDLCGLYSGASALLFPSLCEGFGWPIIEAQACGCPVFTSNRPPMTEVGGDGAVYIDPEDPIEAAKIILENLPHAEGMREAGFANLRRFSTDQMVDGYLNLYASAMNPGSNTNREVEHSVDIVQAKNRTEQNNTIRNAEHP